MTIEGKKSLSSIRVFLKETGIQWPNVYGATTAFEQFEVRRIPAVFVIGRDGKIAWNSGSRSKTKLEDAIEEALASESSP